MATIQDAWYKIRVEVTSERQVCVSTTQVHPENTSWIGTCNNASISPEAAVMLAAALVDAATQATGTTK